VKIFILDKSYTVEFIPDMYDEEHDIAEFDGKNNLFLIEKNTTKENQREAVLHEIIEAINADCFLELTESQISTLSSALYTAKRDGKRVFKL
jgi:hypothetical protein